MPTLSRMRSSGHLEVGARDAGVGHRPGVLDQRLDAAERLPEGEHLGALADGEGLLEPAGDAERDHPAEALHLAGGDLVAGVGREAGVDHLGDPRVAVEELHDPLRVVAVAVHAYAERLEAAVRQEGVERSGDRAHGVLVEADLLGELEVAHDDRSPDDVAVPADVLGRRVHDHVGAERERLLEVGRGEGVVDDEQGARVVRDGGQRLDVADGEHRVGGRLDPHQLGAAGLDGRGDGVGVGHRRRAVVECPRPWRPCRRGGACRRRRRRGSRRGRRAGVSARMMVSSAARPEAKANPFSPSSSAASAPSSAVRVGLAERLYS